MNYQEALETAEFLTEQFNLPTSLVPIVEMAAHTGDPQIAKFTTDGKRRTFTVYLLDGEYGWSTAFEQVE